MKSFGFVFGVFNIRDIGVFLGVCLIEFLLYCYFVVFRVDVELKWDRVLDFGKGKEKEGVDIDVLRGIFCKSYFVFNFDVFGFKYVDEWYYMFLDDGKLEKKFLCMLDCVFGLFFLRERLLFIGFFLGIFNDFFFVNVFIFGKYNNEYIFVELNVYENIVKLFVLLNNVLGLKDFIIVLMYMFFIIGGFWCFMDVFFDLFIFFEFFVEEIEWYNVRDYVCLSFFDKVYKFLIVVFKEWDVEDLYEDLNDLFDWFWFVKKNEDLDNGFFGIKCIKDMFW